MKRYVLSLVNLTATLLALCWRILSPLVRGIGRFNNLVLLRSRCRGTIPVSTQFDGPVRTSGSPRVSIGEHCRLGREVFFETGEGGEIRIGNHVRINTGAMLVAYSRVCVEDECLIGEYVSIRDADHATVPGKPIRQQGHVSSPVLVKKGAWIARGCVILKGVTIGERAVIGAHSVVTKDIPDHALAVGAPARVTRYQTS